MSSRPSPRGRVRSWPPLLRRHPDQTQNYTESHLGRGADYDEGFDTLPMRALMWELEQRALDQMVTAAAKRAPTHRILDLACGTGRITEAVTRSAPSAEVIGVDVAESMLEQARTRVPRARFVVADARRLEAVVDDGSVDLATAFRFFPNADAALAAAVSVALVRAVRPGGHLILNNHRNFWSGSYLARRARSRDGSAPGAVNSSIVGPFLERGFKVVARHSLGVVPQSDEHAYLLSDQLAGRLERFNARRLSGRHTAGTNTVWLLRKLP